MSKKGLKVYADEELIDRSHEKSEKTEVSISQKVRECLGEWTEDIELEDGDLE